MFGQGELYSFVILVLLMIISPGANQVLVLQSGLVLGKRAAVCNVMGVAVSMFVYALLSGLGLMLLLLESPQLHNWIRWLGMAYLLFLAFSSLRSAWLLQGQTLSPESCEAEAAPAESLWYSFLKGFGSNILNVQAAFVFLSIFPQYMNASHSLLMQVGVLTLIFVGLLLGWYACFIFLVSRIRGRLLQPKIQCRIKAVTGFLLLVMAVKMGLA